MDEIFATLLIDIKHPPYEIPHYMVLYWTHVTVCAKTGLVCTTTNLMLLPQPMDTLNIYPSPVYQMLNVNWSAFLKGILLILQSHNWNNSTNAGH